MSRIASLNISARDMIIELSDGVPGALKVLSSILQNPEVFAPATPVFIFFSLDALEIYGSDIWNLGHYVCKDDLTLLKQVLDNNVRDYLTEDVLKYHIQNNLPFDRLYTREEMEQDDYFKRKLPLIEPDLAAQLQGNQPSEQIMEERADANTAKCGDELELEKEIPRFSLPIHSAYADVVKLVVDTVKNKKDFYINLSDSNNPARLHLFVTSIGGKDWYNVSAEIFDGSEYKIGRCCSANDLYEFQHAAGVCWLYIQNQVKSPLSEQSQAAKTRVANSQPIVHMKTKELKSEI